VERLGKGLVKEVKPFDLFRGGRIPKGKKNLAYRIIYQSPDRTLVSEEIQKLQGEIAETLVKKFGAHFQL
jgi:phenylalanyl-tRNA synthetase beta chain